MMNDFNVTKARFDEFLTKVASEFDCEPVLAESMRYSLFSGGKRIRPVLLVKAAETFGKAADESVFNFAAAIECLHVYSLVHDDLPCMDNDDFRRGVPTSHKKFGEDTAVLTGDALLSESFRLVLKSIETGGFSKAHYAAAKNFADKTGATGHINGQKRDLEFDQKSGDEAALTSVYRGKTCALIEAAVGAGALLGGADDNAAENMLGFAEAFGIAFQIADDLLDDDGEKCSIVTVCGRDIAEKRLEEYTEKAINCLDNVDADTTFFRDFALIAKNRKR